MPTNIPLFAIALPMHSGHNPGSNGADWFLLACLLTFSALFFCSLIWVFCDARSRNKSGLLAVIFILLTGWPTSFLWWFWLRPAGKR